MGDSTITIVQIDGGKVKVGVDAPPGVPVYRTELADKYGREAVIADCVERSNRRRKVKASGVA